MAIEDHFYLIQSQSIQTRAMENYFSWLFQEYGLTEDNERVVFQTSLDQDVVGGDLEDIISVNVGGVSGRFEQNIDEQVDTRYFPGPLELSATNDEKLRRQQIGRTTIGKELWKCLSQLIPEQKRLEELEKNFLQLRQVDPAAEIGANLEFFVTMKKRSESSREARKHALQSISNGLRDLPEGTLVLKGKDGVLKNGELTLKCPRNIKLAPPPDNAPNNANSSLLDVEDTFKQMLIVHDRYIEDKKI